MKINLGGLEKIEPKRIMLSEVVGKVMSADKMLSMTHAKNIRRSMIVNKKYWKKM